MSILLISASYRNSASIPHFDKWGWSLTETVSSESDKTSTSPIITIDDLNNIHVMWKDFSDIGGASSSNLGNIFYKFWNITNEKWSATELVSVVSNKASKSPQIAIDSQNNVHIVWVDLTDYLNSGTDGNVFYRSKDYSLGTWSTTSVISNTSSGLVAYVSISFDSKDNFHVAWSDTTPYSGSGVDYDIIYRRYDKLNGSWGTPWVVSWTSTGDSLEPTMTIDTQDNVHIVWTDVTDFLTSGTDKDLFYRFFDSLSNIWSLIHVATVNNVGDASDASIAVDSKNNLHITWSNLYYNGIDFEDDIHYRFWNITSSSWSTCQVISTVVASAPSIAIDNQDNQHIVWIQSIIEGVASDTDIWYSYSNLTANPLVTWSETETVSTLSTLTARDPDMTIDENDNIHVVFSDLTNYQESGIDLDIFYKVRLNLQNFQQSATITETVTDISTTTEDSIKTITKTVGETEETVFTSTIFETNQKSEASLPIFFGVFSLAVLGMISRKKKKCT